MSICFRLFGYLSVANFWPELTPESGRDQFGREAANLLKKGVYIDDRLKAFWYIFKCYWCHQRQGSDVDIRQFLHNFASNSNKTCWKQWPSKIAPKARGVWIFVMMYYLSRTSAIRMACSRTARVPTTEMKIWSSPSQLNLFLDERKLPEHIK